MNVPSSGTLNQVRSVARATNHRIEQAYIQLRSKLSKATRTTSGLDSTQTAANAGKSTRRPGPIDAILPLLRKELTHTALVVAGNMTRELADRLLAEGTADIIAFGRPFISNPDLVERVRNGSPLAEADRATCDKPTERF